MRWPSITLKLLINLSRSFWNLLERLVGTSPTVWNDYTAFDHCTPKRLYEQAVTGKTGIDCFDYWSAELQDTNYLHNHARMWLPAFGFLRLVCRGSQVQVFMRHLFDGDAASNTLGWRWVAGIQTIGKHYVARAAILNNSPMAGFSASFE